ncbi:MAG TPA: phosphate-starvation-inducible PsiE family protein [Terriglobia bacterium]|nr:phosphate-starvation-inducible PsiE family protein [Terriglobia bacterium]
MNFRVRAEKIISGFELAAVVALQALVILLVVASTIVLYMLAIRALRTDVAHIATVDDLLYATERSVAGILVVVLALELLATLSAYFNEHRVRLEVILIVAIIAVSRQVILIDTEHTSGMELIGIAAVIVSLTVGYFLVKRAQAAFPSQKYDATTKDKP